MTVDNAHEYIVNRARDCRRNRGLARSQLASARAEYALKATPLTRRTLVRCLANLHIANAFCEALENVR